MLKWTVANKRHPGQVQQNTRRHSIDIHQSLQDNAIRKPKRRRSSNSSNRRRSHKRSSLTANKENQFTSTPIKSDDYFHAEALRDVSNITPKDTKVPAKILTPNQKKVLCSPKHFKHKKKKRCLDPNHVEKFPFGTCDYLLPDVDEKNDFVDNYSCKVFDEKSSTPKRVTDTYAPTLPTFGMEYSPYGLRSTHNFLNINCNDTARELPLFLSHMKSVEHNHNYPPYKRAKVDHVNDFLQQISLVSSPEDRRLNDSKQELQISPLVQKLVDLRFNNNGNREQCNDSSFINNLSLNELVNVILDNSMESDMKYISSGKDRNTADICDVAYKKECESFSDKNSTDSGFRSNTDSHNIDANFICECKEVEDNHLRKTVPMFNCDKTIINIDETFNERCVDDDFNVRKRHFSTTAQEDDNFTLKRQRCVRRRRLIKDSKKNHQRKDDNYNFTLCDQDFHINSSLDSSLYESNDVTNSSSKMKSLEYGSSTLDESQNMRRIRRCLQFESPVSDNSSISSSKHSVTGSMELEIEHNSNEITLKVLRCNDLVQSKDRPVNAYIKVSLSDGRKKQQGTLQRTAVQAESCRPMFNHTFHLPLLKTDFHKRLFIEVWHRDRICRRSKFLGCMSFSVKNVIKKNINGHFYLLPQPTGRCQNVPMTTDHMLNLTDSRTFLQQEQQDSGSQENVLENKRAMCESQWSVEEAVMTAEDIDGELKKSTVTSKAVLSEQQKLADENLFLRYLELDPLEGPDAIPAALQRKATGNKNGRTPFTTTKKLNRQPKTGFGFSVVWTHPPRVERVEKGLPADRAGILPGDYIIFVDKHNVVMMPEIDILNLIRSYGSQLTLEIFRRNTSRNGSVSNVRRLTSVGTESSTILPATSVSTQRRPSTVCSTTNTTSIEYNRRKLHLPQVTFSAEVGNGILV